MNGEMIEVRSGPPTAGTAPVMVSTAAPPVVPLKIKTLTVCDFRAFAGPEPVRINLNGKNLLIYGENGSGKSSIFHALNEVFSIELAGPAERQARFADLRNRFSGLAPADGYIEIELDDGKPAVRWDHARHPADITPASDARIVNGAWRKAILDYRALLDTNYRHGAGTVNLFDVCIRVLLRDYPLAHNGRQWQLFDLWRTIEDYLRKKQLRARELSEINALAASFNRGLRDALDLLLPEVDSLLADLGWADLKLTALTTPGVTYNGAKSKTARAFGGQTVSPEITYRALALPAPQNFLNEARLSALALAIYFAGRKVCAATLQADTPRLMVLDDVLIGLDQSNRLPVLQALDKNFADWQIVLLTHDRVWFEGAVADRVEIG
jgi:energy-coupling factor transporter ATP-binding protein EcfA2